MKNAKISVIVPVYKVEEYLDRCIQSIMNQTYKNFELILVDDGSPDCCAQICDEWKKRDERIRVIHKKNGGLSSARNVGLDIATGEYINFVDSDDWMTPDALEHLYWLCKEYEADFSTASWERTDGNNIVEQSDYKITLLNQEEFLQRFFKVGTQENVQYTWAKLYRSELFQSIRFPEGLILEDLPTTFQIALKSQKIVHSTKKIYCYFWNPESLSASFNEKRFDLLRVWDLICAIAKKDSSSWIQEYASICRARADLGILCDFEMSNLSYKEKKKYRDQIKPVLENLHHNRQLLLRAEIPFSRKVMVCSFCISYPMTSSMIYVAIRVGKCFGWRYRQS